MATRAEKAAVAALTAAYVARQRLLATTLTRDLILLVRQLFMPSSLGPSWTVTKTQLDALIRARRSVSATLGARYYLDVRAVHVRPPGRQARRAAPVPRRAVQAPQVPDREPVRDVLDQVDREPDTERVDVDIPERELEAEFGLDSDDEDDVWAELGRIAGVGPPDLDDERVESNLTATGIASYQRAIRAGQTPTQAIDTMAVNLAGSATRLAAEGGRQVIRDAVDGDDAAIGWMRITDGDACSWCLMLASRGAVYKSAQTAGRAKNRRFTGPGQFKWHDHCGCVAVPIFDADDPRLDRADELYAEWLRVTQGKSGKAAVNAWRQHWEKQRQQDN